MDKIDSYVLCLTNNPERYNNVMKIKDLIKNINIVEAVDAKTISGEEIEHLKNTFLKKENNKFQDMYGRKFKLGSICCTLSHLKILELIKNKQNNLEKPYALILEDDIELSPSFEDVINMTLNKIEKDNIDIDMVNLHIMEDKKKDYARFKEFDIIRVSPGYWGTQAYLLKQTSAEKIIKSLSKYKNPIDEQLSRDYSLKYYNIVGEGLDLLKRSNFLPSHILDITDIDY